jgi:phosphopantetheinyl transferase (holo-ACP synthase)
MFPTALTQIRAMPIPHLAESGTVMACLSSPEHRLMANYRHPRRRHEFVAGRLALKRALLETQGSAVRIGSATPLPAPLLPAAQRMQVMPDDDGHPRLWVEGTVVSTQVSIAHAVGWAAAACSHLPIGVDVVDVDAPAAVPHDDPWLSEVEPDWRVRLSALLWGLRECLLKTGQISAKTLWSLNDVEAVPTRPASEIIARWPRASSLAPLHIQVEKKRVAGAFVLLSRSAMLVMILMPAPHR